MNSQKLTWKFKCTDFMYKSIFFEKNFLKDRFSDERILFNPKSFD